MAVVPSVQATTHIVQFLGTLGFNYSPNSLNVSVRNTFEWQDDFTMHPLSSTSVPSGAQSFHQASGSVFFYSVTVAGTYNYQCGFHFSIGMTSSFVTSVTGIKNDLSSLKPYAFRLGQNFPNPFDSTATVSFDIPF